MSTWLVLDCPFLCHRAFHSTGALRHDGEATGVVFGFMKTLGELTNQFATDDVVFCFDSKHSLRQDAYPHYKSGRRSREQTQEERESYDEFHQQVVQLRRRWLPECGFRNVFCYKGLESDDIMAMLCNTIPETDDIVLVTSDMDLLQCLKHNVILWSPSKGIPITEISFRTTWGIPPSSWSMVKAIAGCSSDDVQGVRGVGEKTAVKYLKGDLGTHLATHARIISAQGRAMVERNLPLVSLPHSATPVPKLKKDQVTKTKWKQVCSELGMRSVAGRPPVSCRKS
ncbi:MAG: putative ribonuclease H [Prokaryotic dsDNA virus sp.]|nr:MAG: putative ribonuclease H [Prokaryotic dsDNA virus sp.]|tara:strand:- start:1544 stop:2395 length:852 start_codon:yes stop_codon:yes gene_type:complete